MARTVSATEARVHFGEIIREATESGEPILVERSGKPQVVIVSQETWERMSNGERVRPKWQVELERFRREVHETHPQLRNVNWDDEIHAMREERSEELVDNLLRRESGGSVDSRKQVAPDSSKVG